MLMPVEFDRQSDISQIVRVIGAQISCQHAIFDKSPGTHFWIQ
jgi:hypothetical protein